MDLFGPLAYLLGVEGVALLRAFTGEYDQEFTEARLSNVRRAGREGGVPCCHP